MLQSSRSTDLNKTQDISPPLQANSADSFGEMTRETPCDDIVNFATKSKGCSVSILGANAMLHKSSIVKFN